MRVRTGHIGWLKPPQRHVQPLAAMLIVKAPKVSTTAFLRIYRTDGSPDTVSTLIGIA